MPNPVPEDQTPDAASMSNAISSRTVEAVSHEHQQGETQEREARTDDQPAQPGDSDHVEPQVMGDVPPTAAVESPDLDDASRAKKLAASVMNRLKASKQWFGLVDLVRDQMMREAKATIPDLVQRQLWVYSELDRMYPPVQPKPADSDTGFVGSKGVTSEFPIRIGNLGEDSGSIQGLSDLPKGWPELPANAALSAEVGWVQANRLFMVEERPGKATLVRLDQAASPAPSRAALGWLETSIRSYAKFVDVAAKVSGGAEDEGAVMRRERKSVDEVKALLREMEESEDTCPHCGRPRP